MRKRLTNFHHVFSNVAYCERAIAESGLTPETYIYGARGRLKLKLDVYRAPSAGDTVQPVIVYFHGGGWRVGHRSLVEPAFIAQVAHGYTLVSVTYTLVPAAIWPAQIEDCHDALDWLKAHADELHIDTNHIVTTGASAGGQLALLLGLERSDVRGVVAYYPPTDFTTMAGRGAVVRTNFRQLFGKRIRHSAEELRHASPLYQLHPGAPPLLVLHGTDDHFVIYEQSQRFIAQAQTLGIDAALITLHGAVHSDKRLNEGEGLPAIEAFLDHLHEARPKANEQLKSA